MSNCCKDFLKCHTNCVYFPRVDQNIKFIVDEKGLKRREKPFNYVCGYDDHIIKDWSEECPKAVKLK
jgi:hypothetical protein